MIHTNYPARTSSRWKELYINFEYPVRDCVPVEKNDTKPGIIRDNISVEKNDLKR